MVGDGILHMVVALRPVVVSNMDLVASEPPPVAASSNMDTVTIKLHLVVATNMDPVIPDNALATAQLLVVLAMAHLAHIPIRRRLLVDCDLRLRRTSSRLVHPAALPARRPRASQAVGQVASLAAVAVAVALAVAAVVAVVAVVAVAQRTT